MPTSDTIGKSQASLAFDRFFGNDVCLEAGFSSLGTFSYVFTRRVGMLDSLPEKFRSLMRGPGELPHQLIPDASLDVRPTE